MTSSLPRILHITVGLGYGGMEMMLARLIEADQGAREHWVVGMMDETSPDPTDSYTQRLTALGARVFSLGFPRGRPTLRGMLRLWRIFHRCRPSLLSGWNYHGNLAATLLSLLTIRSVNAVANVRCSVQLRPNSNLFERAFFALHAHAARYASAVIFNSKRSANEHERRGYPGSRLVVIPNGFDVERFRPDPILRDEARRTFALSDHDIAVGSIGRFHRDKDHATFLRAAVEASRLHSHLVFLVAGAGTEAILQDPFLARQIEEIGTSSVKIMGHVSHMQLLYNALDICVLSSTAEGFPNVIGEAMACGVPCVSTDVGDAAYIIGDTGLLCPHSDPVCLGKQIVSMAQSNISAQGRAARKRIVDKFSMPPIYGQFAQLWARFSTRSTNRLSAQRGAA